MFHLPDAILFGCAFVLILGVSLAVREFLANRKRKSAPFLDYFGPEYERDLLQQSALSETQSWRGEGDARFTPFRLGDQGTSERRTRVSGSVRRDRDSE